MNCPYCGLEHAPAARFCPHTGKKLAEIKTCPACGEVVPAAGNFCPYCRAALKVSTPVPAIVTETEPGASAGSQGTQTTGVAPGGSSPEILDTPESAAAVAGAILAEAALTPPDDRDMAAPDEPALLGMGETEAQAVDQTGIPPTPPAPASADKYTAYMEKFGAIAARTLALGRPKDSGAEPGERAAPPAAGKTGGTQPAAPVSSPGETGKVALAKASTLLTDYGARLGVMLTGLLAFLREQYTALLPRLTQLKTRMGERPIPWLYAGSLALGIVLMIVSAILLIRLPQPTSSLLRVENPPAIQASSASPLDPTVSGGAAGTQTSLGVSQPGLPTQPGTETALPAPHPTEFVPVFPPVHPASRTAPAPDSPAANPPAVGAILPSGSPVTPAVETPAAPAEPTATAAPESQPPRGFPAQLILRTGLAPVYTWAEPVTVDNDPEAGVVNSLAVDSNGRVHIAYYRDVAKKKDVFYAFGKGTSWKTHLPVQEDKANVGNFLSLALNNQGRPYVAYNDRSLRRIRLARLHDGAISATVVADGAPLEVGLIKLIFDKADKANILYHDLDIGSLVTQRQEGSRWVIGSVKYVSPDMKNFGLAKGPDGSLAVSYYRDGLKLARQDGDAWVEEALMDGAGVGIASALAITPDGSIHILAYSDPLGSLHYLTNASVEWSAAEIEATGAAPYGAIAVDPRSGAVLLSYSRVADGSLHLARIIAGEMSSEMIARHGPKERYISMVVDQNGLAHISYYNDEDIRLMYLHATQTTANPLSAAPAQQVAPASSPTVQPTAVENLVQPSGNLLTGGIAFHSNRSGSKEIWVMNPDGSSQRQVTFHGRDTRSPSWSPDGRQLAYQSFVNGFMGIFVIDLASGQSRQVTNDGCDQFAPSWSPDSRSLAYYSHCQGNREIWVMDLNGANQTRLTDTLDWVWNWWPTWSPDGSQITFASNRTGEYRVFVMNTDGSNQHPLAEGCFPSFSPDGQSIVFSHFCTKSGEIYRINADGTGQTTLLGERSYTSPSWSPDGQRIVYVSNESGDGDIWVMNRDGSDRIPLTENDNLDDSPVWR